MGSSKLPTLRQNFSWTFIGNAIYVACQWGMLVILAKLGSPEMVGQFTLGLSVTAPVVMFAGLQLSAIQATDARREFAFTDYLSLRVGMVILAILTIIGITATTDYRWETSLIILVLGLAKCIESISDIFYGLLQQHERMDRISLSMIMKGILSLFLFTAGVFLTRGVLWGSVGLVIAWSIILVGYDIYAGKILNSPHSNRTSAELKTSLLETIRLKWNFKTQKRLIRLALPLGFVMMLISLNSNIPRYVIERYWSEGELGIFAALAYLMVAESMIVNALGQSVGPRLSKYYAAGNRTAFQFLLFRLLGIGLLLGGIGVLLVLLAGRELLTLIYNQDYAEHVDLLVWLMVATSINNIGSFLGNGMSAVRMFDAQLPVFAIVTAVSAIASFYFIPGSGLHGAVIALILAAIAQVLLSAGVIMYALHKLPTSALTGDCELEESFKL
jgi:O-antigen/teichoic acid export membrane protein